MRKSSGAATLVSIVRVAPERSLAGVVLHDSKSYEGARVTFSRLEKRSSLAHQLPDAAPASGPGGAFTLFSGRPMRRSRASSWSRRARTSPGCGPGSFALREGALDGIRVESVAGADLEIHVEGQDCRAVSDAHIDIRGDSEAPLKITGRTGAEGTWRLPALPAGKYRVEAYLQDARGLGNTSFEWDAEAPGSEAWFGHRPRLARFTHDVRGRARKHRDARRS